VAFLAIGTIGEQVKTRLEVAREESEARDVSNQPLLELPSGVSYQDLRIGGGSTPQQGYLVVLNFRCPPALLEFLMLHVIVFVFAVEGLCMVAL
jgi:hypothetical protein